MMTWKRRGWFVVLGLALCSGAQADQISLVGETWHEWTTFEQNFMPGGMPVAETISPPPAYVFPPIDSSSVSNQPSSSGSASTAFAPVLATSTPTSPTTPAVASASFSIPSAPPTTSSAPVANGFINLGTGPYPDAASIASGNPQPWYTSPQVASLFGGQPNAQQQADFTSTVLQRVEQTFRLSGVSVNLTTDPNVSAAHTLSVVSNSTSIPFPNSIGTSDVGANGFSFIDQIAKSAQSVDQLETIVAHNLAHELMLTFGVPEKFDQTGNYIDATTATWAMITSPTATFSPAAAAALNQAIQSADATSGTTPLAQLIEPQPVPEPTTILAWGVCAVAFATIRFKKARRSIR